MFLVAALGSWPLSSQGSAYTQMSWFFFFLHFSWNSIILHREGSIGRAHRAASKSSKRIPNFAHVCRSFITILGAPTPVSRVTATQWVPSHGHVTPRRASASAGLASLGASATHATTHLLRSQTPAARVSGLFTLAILHFYVLYWWNIAVIGDF